ncbi:hypothetical protein [Niveibacterium sp. COAC-50]|uniref:hypothetical protein n=1 Tax=Niveibacterium sp. COAC-50 TaxID=2729384 RepID=UPI001552D3F1|nr:hypothetical protein [Niveibacterium sp. COAC-50]
MSQENYIGIVFVATKTIRTASTANVTVRTAKAENRRCGYTPSAFFIVVQGLW